MKKILALLISGLFLVSGAYAETKKDEKKPAPVAEKKAEDNKKAEEKKAEEKKEKQPNIFYRLGLTDNNRVAFKFKHWATKPLKFTVLDYRLMRPSNTIP